MANAPEGLTLKRHRDLDGRGQRPTARRILVALLCVPIVLGLLNFFGQRPSTSAAATAAASLEVYAPKHVRGGLYFEARFHIVARRDLKDVRLILDSNWLEGMTINEIEPGPVSETSRGGDLDLELGKLKAGDGYIQFVQMQVNPTNVGRRPLHAELWDGDTHLLTVSRTLVVFP